MTRAQAFTKIKRILGPNAHVDVGNEITSPEKRQAAHDAAESFRQQRTELDARITSLQKVLLDHPEYKALQAQRTALRKQFEQVNWQQSRYKFQAGIVSDLGPFNAFHVRASGDTWEEVIAKLEKERRKDP